MTLSHDSKYSTNLANLSLVVPFVAFFLVTNLTSASTTDKQVLEEILETQWIGDFDQMIKRQVIRVLVVHNKMQYFLDGPVQRGLSYESMKLFEKEINKKLNNSTITVDVVFIPVTREKLIPSLINGYGDIAAANLTITPQRQTLVDFGDPLLTNVKEVMVSGPSVPTVSTLNDLSGMEIYVRRSSSYYESLSRFNQILINSGKAPIKLLPSPESLEDSDLIEMVDAGLLPLVFVDLHKANFWKKVFTKTTIHEDLYFGGRGNIAWAFRKNSPLLKAAIDQFVKKNRKGTLTGNILHKRYLETNKWAKNLLADNVTKKYSQQAEYFKRYGKDYGFDWLLLTALGYQESQLDQSQRSSSGAIGVMQLLPSTAADKNVAIPNIEKVENNIHAGTKYLRFLRDRYFSMEEITPQNRVFFSLAAYNAGPARVSKLKEDHQNLLGFAVGVLSLSSCSICPVDNSLHSNQRFRRKSNIK